MSREAEIRARVDAATEGPWQADMAWVQLSADQQICEGYDDEQGLDDVLFIAHAREDVPYLLDRLAELEAALRTIASCEARVSGDVVDIARAALAEEPS